MNNEYKMPKSKQNFRNLKLLRFLLLDDENKSNYYLIKFNETYELVIFNSQDNFKYETEDYTHSLKFQHDINILQIQVFNDNDEVFDDSDTLVLIQNQINGFLTF